MDLQKRDEPNKYCIYNLYAILIVLIVVGEFINQSLSGSNTARGLFLFIYSFHMPLLMFINGLVCKEYVKNHQRIIPYIIYYISLYVAQKIIICIARWLFIGEFSFNLFKDSDAPWYFLIIAVYLLMASYIQKTNKKKILMMSFFISIACGYIQSIGDILILSRLLVFSPYFVLGQICDCEKLFKIKNRKWTKIFGGICLIIFLYLTQHYTDQLYILRPLLTGRNPYIELGKYAHIGWLLRTMTYLISIGMSFSVLSLMIGVNSKNVFTNIGKRFLQIYFWYRPILYVLTGINSYGWLKLHFGKSYSKIIWVICALILIMVLSTKVITKHLFLHPYWWDKVTIYQNIKLKFKKLFFSTYWNWKEYFVIYALAFLLSFLVSYSSYWINGKTFILSGDGTTQHYLMFTYIGQYIRRCIADIRTQGFNFPMFDLSMGMGDDIIGFANSLGATEPLMLLSAFVPVKYSEYLYCFLSILRLFLAGLSFSYLCFYFKKNWIHTLIGSIVYCFCGYALIASLGHIFYLNPMILLPLLIVGTDKIVKKEKPYLFIFTVFYSALCGYYHLYMMTIMILIYAVVRFFDIYTIRRCIEFVKAIGRGIFGYSCGIGLAAFIFIPSVLVFLSGNRIGFSNYIPGVLSWAHFRNHILRLIAPASSNAWTYPGFAAIVWPALVLLLFSYHKNKKVLQRLVIIAWIFWLSNLGGLIMNGFQYSSGRWMFGFSFIMAFVVVDMLPCLLDMSTSDKWICVSSLLIYGVMALSTASARKVTYVLIGLGFLALTMLMLEIESSKKDIVFSRLRVFLCLLLVIFNVGINSIYRLSSDQGNYIGKFSDIGKETQILESSAEKEVAQYLGTVLDGRADGSSFVRNRAMVWQIPGMLTYNSVANDNMIEFWKQVEISTTEQAFKFISSDQRPIINTLLSEKYHIETRNEIVNVPYGYVPTFTTERGRTIFENQYALPWGYTYDHQISYQDLEMLNGLQKEEMMLRAIALEQKLDSKVPTEMLAFDENCIPYEIACEGCEWTSDNFIVSKANATITLKFLMPQNTQGYIRLSGLDINDSGLTTFQINVTCDEVSKNTLVASDLWNFYYGRENYLFNLGYNDKERTTCIITFPSKGTFKLKDIELYALSMDNYPKYVEALREEPLENIELTANHISGTVNLSKDKILCMSVPYSKGWSATVDGKKTEIFCGNYMFMALPLSKGHHDIVFSYCSPGLKLGFIITLFCVGLVSILLIEDKLKRKKDKKYDIGK